MLILSSTQRMMKLFGYLESYSRSKYYVAYRYLTYISTWNLLLPMSLYGIKNYNDIAVLAETISLGAGEWNAMAKGFVLITNLHIITPLMAAVQQNVDQRERLGQHKNYVAMDRHANRLSRLVYGWMFSSITSISLGPIVLMFVAWWQAGEMRPEMLRQPVEMVMPYDLTTLPAFLITYVCCILSTICIGCTMVIVDCIFLGLCSHIMACQLNLQDLLVQLDAEIADTDQLYSAAVNRKVAGRLRQCIRFHYDIFEKTTQLAAVFSPVIFTQFVLSVVQIGTLAFQIQLGVNVTIDRYVANGITSIVALIELLIYCYFGNEVSEQGEQIAVAAYDTKWYRYDAKLRLSVWMVMLRSQEPYYFLGFNYMVCTLQSYTAVLNMVGSALALLKSVV